MKGFWKEINNKINKVKQSNIIDGEAKERTIIDIFTRNFLPDDVLCEYGGLCDEAIIQNIMKK